MADRAIVRPAGDSGRLAVEGGEQPAIRLERQVELQPILAASATIGGLLNRVGAIEIGGGKRVNGDSHCSCLILFRTQTKAAIACGSMVLLFFCLSFSPRRAKTTANS